MDSCVCLLYCLPSSPPCFAMIRQASSESMLEDLNVLKVPVTTEDSSCTIPPVTDYQAQIVFIEHIKYHLSFCQSFLIQ